MADLATIIEDLRAALEKNDRQRLALIDDSDRIQAALKALGVTVPEQAQPVGVVHVPKPAESRPKKPEARPAPAKPAATGHTCPVCGDAVATTRGLSIHVALKHKAAEEPKPAAPIAPAKPTNGKVLQCGECDFTAELGRVGELNRHCLTEHHRVATSAERTPVAAA